MIECAQSLIEKAEDLFNISKTLGNSYFKSPVSKQEERMYEYTEKN